MPVWSNVHDHIKTLYSVLHVLYCMTVHICTHCNVSILHVILIVWLISGATPKSEPIEVEGGLLVPYNLSPDRYLQNTIIVLYQEYDECAAK